MRWEQEPEKDHELGLELGSPEVTVIEKIYILLKKMTLH